MIRDICKDEVFLARQAEPAGPEDLAAAADLLETLEHHREGCVGMAANMIGVNKRIIAFDNEGTYQVMFSVKAQYLGDVTGYQTQVTQLEADLEAAHEDTAAAQQEAQQAREAA